MRWKKLSQYYNNKCCKDICISTVIKVYIHSIVLESVSFIRQRSIKEKDSRMKSVELAKDVKITLNDTQFKSQNTAITIY